MKKIGPMNGTLSVRSRQEIRNNLLFSLSRITSGFLLIRSTTLILPLLHFLLDYFAYFISNRIYLNNESAKSSYARNNSTDDLTTNFII